MPKRQDIKSVLIIGAGPIVIGQACEFDYSGVQACKALKEEDIRVILVNSNPATIMTDQNMADATYIEPTNPEFVGKIIALEKPDAILPTMGGQTALNCALELERNGVLKKYGVELIGANANSIDKAENRERFRRAMLNIGLDILKSDIAHSLEEAWSIQAQIGYPIIIRPSFTLGGTGGGIAYNSEEFEQTCKRGLSLSPTNELLIEESVLGWKEFEMEVVRDKNDNAIIVCSIENFDPMGVHTGDSITVAPAQTLTDKEYQIMRDASLAVIREIGIETGGSNVQFAVNPENGRMIVIEMNPRVSRSSALASKATGFPIAKVASKLAIGYTLDELENDITSNNIPASFEPVLDYVVTKIPRFAFEKFPQADTRLSTQMKSVGEVMAIGRNFSESLQKAIRSLEVDKFGLDSILGDELYQADEKQIRDKLRQEISKPGPERLWYLGDAFRQGWSIEEVYEFSKIDSWFLYYIDKLIKLELEIIAKGVDYFDKQNLLGLKKLGFSDYKLAKLTASSEAAVRKIRHAFNIRPVYKRVDTCAGEFDSKTSYMYSCYDEFCEAKPKDEKKILVLGSGPNRIGQGIEFDYCCVQSSYAIREVGYKSIMLNCNPETVSTDYDTSDILYFEPLTLEDVLEVIWKEEPTGVVVQYGGQTPLKLAHDLQLAGVPIIGTSPNAIDMAEDREKFQKLLKKLKIQQPLNRLANKKEEALVFSKEIGYPIVVRPSYVLGGRAMEIVYSESDLERYIDNAVSVSHSSPVLLDSYLDNAIELDVDAICDGKDVVIGGIMQHIEQAGIHSGDSACSLPPYSISKDIQKQISRQLKKMAIAIGVKGLMNAQFAVKGDDIYVLEVNPRASRTVPFVAKSIGVDLAKIATKVMIGKTLKELGYTKEVLPKHFSAKEAVFPFIKFLGVDPILGPEMKSTGEVMGVGNNFGESYAKALIAAGINLPAKGKVVLSVRNADRSKVIEVARKLVAKGFEIVATRGTAKAISEANIKCDLVNKVKEGRPHIVDLIINKEVSLIVNTSDSTISIADSFDIRREALMHSICYTTTISGCLAMIEAMDYLKGLQPFKIQNI